MGLISSLYYVFAPYAGAHERAIGSFFARLTEHTSSATTRTRVGDLLQSNIAAINLWTEYRYKGYTYLKKSTRRQLYNNLERIRADFDQFYANTREDPAAIRRQVYAIAPEAIVESEKIVLLHAIMQYLAPQRGLYKYRDSSSFGRLLRDPTQELLEGDCNQIVTLYIYLYSRYFSVQDLKVRLLPGHIALHYGGVDIETTNGTYADYSHANGQRIMPIEEIVSVNLLDTTDTHFAQHAISPQDFLQSARYAFILSGERATVTQNLDAAYAKLINSLMAKHDYASALTFAKQSKDIELLSIVGNNGALHYMQQKDFTTARRFAEHAVKKSELVRDSYQAEGAFLYDAGRYYDAMKAFKRYGDQSYVKKCYEALFMREQEKLGEHLTSDSIRQHASVIKRMHAYAKKSGNKQLIEHADTLQRHL